MTRRVWLPFRALILASFKIERVKNGLVSLKEKRHGEEPLVLSVLMRSITLLEVRAPLKL